MPNSHTPGRLSSPRNRVRISVGAGALEAAGVESSDTVASSCGFCAATNGARATAPEIKATRPGTLSQRSLPHKCRIATPWPTCEVSPEGSPPVLGTVEAVPGGLDGRAVLPCPQAETAHWREQGMSKLREFIIDPGRNGGEDGARHR